MMAENYRETTRQILNLKNSPEYDFAAITASIKSVDEPIQVIHQILASRKLREAEEERRRKENQKLQRRLEQDAAEREEQEQQRLEQEEAQQQQQPGVQAAEDDMEPAAMEPLALVPQQPLPAVDLAPLALLTGASPDTQMSDSQSDPDAEGFALLQQLLAAPHQLFTFLGAHDAQAASTVLGVLFQMVSYGTNPYCAYEAMILHYREAPKEELGWSPQLSDIFAAITRLGYQPPHGQPGHRGARVAKRSSGGAAAATGGPGPGPSQLGGAGGGGAAGPSGSAAGGGALGSGGGGAPVANLRCLLRLLVDLVPLHLAGRVELGCGNAEQATGKDLLAALLRMQMDPDLSAALPDALGPALEALMEPWDETLWRRIRDATAAQAAELGPSHRAACRLIGGARGNGERVREWQQAAALQLLKRELPPQSRASGSGAAAAGGRSLAEARELLCPRPTDEACMKLMKALRRGQAGGGRGAGGPTDFWRLLTLLQCAHMVVWAEAYCCEEGSEDDTEVARAARWVNQLFTCMEKCVRGQNMAEMQVRVFLSEVRNQYDFGCAIVS